MSVLLVLQNHDGGIEHEEILPEDYYPYVVSLGWHAGGAINFGTEQVPLIVLSMDERSFIPDGEVREIVLGVPVCN